MKLNQFETTQIPNYELEISEISANEKKYFEKLIKDSFIPGLSYAALSNGKISFGAVGISDMSTGAPVTHQTRFEAASLSKPVFTYLVLKLIENKLLAPDFLKRPLCEFLPNYEKLDENISKEDLKALIAKFALSHQK